MLKIKDSVDLETLEHCYISDDKFDQIWSCKEVLFDKDTRVILTYQFLNEKRLDNLYDLIKMDLVEKVSD